MPKNKKPSTRHQPKGIVILHDDRDILVVNKSAGLLTMGTEREKENTAYYRLTDYVRKGNSKSRKRIFVVHRLDRDVSGVLVFAKTIEAKETLQGQWEDAEKKYLAIVYGTPEEEEEIISSYLTENKALITYSTSDTTKGKLSRTAYKVLKETKKFSLLEINLLTGRKNQIRAHLSEMGHPIVGDKKYGRKDKEHKRLALHAKSLTFKHPFNGKQLTFTTPPPRFFARLMGDPEQNSTAKTRKTDPA